MLDNDQTLIDKLHNNICSTAQDIIYLASAKKKLTPKHIGLGLTLHQATRSEKLVEMFHAAGHTIGMDTIRHIDTHRDYKRIEWASVEKSRDKLNKSNGGSGI